MKSIRIRIHIRRPDLYPSAGYIPFRISIRPPDMYPSAGYEENLDLRESSASMWFHCCVSWYIVVTLHVFAHTMQIWTVKNQLWNVKDGGAAATQDQWYYFTILDKERSKSSHYFISMVGPSIGRSFMRFYVRNSIPNVFIWRKIDLFNRFDQQISNRKAFDELN